MANNERNKERAEQDKRKQRGTDQAAWDRYRRNNQSKALSKKAEREAEQRWKNRGGGGGDDVIDTGMFR
jgi:hypothetical protein